jgi:hypothetical protein
MIPRPAETIAGVVGGLITAIVAVLALFGITVPPQVLTALTALVGAVAGLVTWYISTRQRDPLDPLTADDDGAVIVGDTGD